MFSFVLMFLSHICAQLYISTIMIIYDNYDLIGCDPRELSGCSSSGYEHEQKSHTKVCLPVKNKFFNDINMP